MATTDLNTPLSALQFAALKGLESGSPSRAFSGSDITRLASLGFVRKILGGAILTELGRVRLGRGGYRRSKRSCKPAGFDCSAAVR